MQRPTFILPALLVLGLGLNLTGCATTGGNTEPSAAQRLPERYALPEVDKPRQAPREGTIYNGEQGLDLYRDNRARDIGDIVQVQVVETSSGQKSAETTTERDSSINGGIDNFFGLGTGGNDNFFGLGDFMRKHGTVKAGLTRDFEGTGDTSRNSDVSATISARIIDKTMNGNLVIRGYQEVRVNNETQFIILSGLVRPDDITSDNAVFSNRIADARIEYSGKGELASSQKPGWLSRTVDVVWPF
ncbi:MAG: flagellar basal body L-ring protein FlgH [Desulfurivibrio sp.]|nr:flagellar basal body L-ring protein FlgH [Desulfurivibrio sp.]